MYVTFGVICCVRTKARIDQLRKSYGVSNKGLHHPFNINILNKEYNHVAATIRAVGQQNR